MTTKSEEPLHVREDPVFARHEWRIQRAGWALMYFVLLLALLGVFGRGPLSHARAVDGTLQVEYERFVHANTPSTIRVTVLEVSGDILRIGVDRRYLDTILIQYITPKPVRVQTSADQVIYEFAATDGASAHVFLDVNPRNAGVPDGMLRVLSGSTSQAVHVRQVVYP